MATSSLALCLLAWPEGAARAQAPADGGDVAPAPIVAAPELDAAAFEDASSASAAAVEAPLEAPVAAVEDAGAGEPDDSLAVVSSEDATSSVDAGVLPPPVHVVVRAHVAFDVRRDLGAQTAAERARLAAAAIEMAIESDVPPPPATLAASLYEPDALVLRLGEHEVLTFDAHDAEAIGLPMNVFAEDLRARVDAFVAREREKSELQSRFSSVALIVVFGVALLFAIQLVRSLGRRADAWVQSKTNDLPGISFGQFEVLSAQTVQSAAYVLVGATRLLTLVGLVYAYAAYSFNQFDSTRAWLPHVTPRSSRRSSCLASGSAARCLRCLFVVAAYVVRACFRFIGFFFEHLGQEEVGSTWLPADLAPAARPIARAALVVVALLALGPLVSGNSDGLLSRVGFLAMAGLALAAIPVTASALVGAVAIFTRRYRVGEWIRVGRTPVARGADVPRSDAGRRVRRGGCGSAARDALVAGAPPAGAPPIVVEVPVTKSVAPDDVLAALTGGGERSGTGRGHGRPRRHPRDHLRRLLDRGQAGRPERAPAGHRSRRAEPAEREQLMEALKPLGGHSSFSSSFSSRCS